MGLVSRSPEGTNLCDNKLAPVPPSAPVIHSSKMACGSNPLLSSLELYTLCVVYSVRCSSGTGKIMWYKNLDEEMLCALSMFCQLQVVELG